VTEAFSETVGEATETLNEIPIVDPTISGVEKSVDPALVPELSQTAITVPALIAPPTDSVTT
jgi:hypothetical protein